jgi:hypothetical protein
VGVPVVKDPVQRAEYMRRYRETHKEELRILKRGQYLRRREELIEKQRAYYQAHREELIAKDKARYQARPGYKPRGKRMSKEARREMQRLACQRFRRIHPERSLAYRALTRDRISKRMKTYYAANAGELKAKSIKYHRANRDRVLLRQKEYYMTHREQAKECDLKRKYGLTLAAFRALLERQDNACASCGTKTPGKKGWAVDHDHVSGFVRGILCARCNTGIGLLGDNLQGLLRAVAYLEKQAAHSHVA